MRRLLRRLLGVCVALAVLALLGWGFVYEPSRLLVVEHPLAIEGAAEAGLSGLKIAIIADLHAGAPFIGEDKIRTIVARTNAIKPDIVLLLGDYVIHGVWGGRPIPMKTVAPLLGALKAPLGVYAVLGNHDWWQDYGGISRQLEAAGITMMDDRGMQIRREEQSFYLVGISDFHQGPHDVRGALEAVPGGHKALCITHTPDLFPELPDTCLLTLAAHTHGGQVRLPLIGAPIVPSQYGRRYVAGLVKEGARYEFTATGIGTSIIPVRLGVPPEITVLTITDAKPDIAAQGRQD